MDKNDVRKAAMELIFEYMERSEENKARPKDYSEGVYALYKRLAKDLESDYTVIDFREDISHLRYILTMWGFSEKEISKITTNIRYSHEHKGWYMNIAALVIFNEKPIKTITEQMYLYTEANKRVRAMLDKLIGLTVG